jgi:uncharacterized membrane protein (UPF0136 family)
VLVALLALGLAASGWIVWARHLVESEYRVVEVAIDSDDWRILAVREGHDNPAFWQQLRRLGAGSIAVYDSTLRRLAESGLVAYLDGATLLAQARTGSVAAALQPLVAGADPSTVYVLPANAEVASLIRSGFATAIGSDRVERVRDEPPIYRVHGRLRDLEETGLGFLPSAVAAWERQGFRVILRPRNVRSMTAEGLQQRVHGYAAFGRGRTVVFDLAEVLGHERLIEEAAASLLEIDAVYGRTEILTEARRMRGEEAMARLMRPRVVRVFSIAPEELHRIEMREAVDRYVRGVRERNLRLLYVRPFLATPGGVNATEYNLDYLRAIVSGVRDAGFTLGVAPPLPAPAVPRGLLYGAVAAAAVAMAWSLALLAERARLRVPVWMPVVLAAAGVLAAGLLSAAGYAEWMRKLYALGAATAFPTLAVVYGVRGLWAQDGLRDALPGALRIATLRLWAISAGSAVGGLVVGALLAEWSFMLAFDVFFGVRIATVVPIVLVGALLVLEFDRNAPGGPRGLVNRVREVLDQPVTLRLVVGAVLIGGLVLLLMLRMGNTGVPVLELEERLRVALERAFVARPRTKEFLLGHPALMLGIAAAVAGLRRWALPLILLGMIGQTGLVNSFAHIHTPFVHSVWRTVSALALGTAVGAVMILFAQSVLQRWIAGGWRPRSDIRYPTSDIGHPASVPRSATSDVEPPVPAVNTRPSGPD